MPSPSPTKPAQPAEFVEEVELRGHIIDSLLLPKILDQIMAKGGSFNLKNVLIGQTRTDPSRALIEIAAPTRQKLDEIIRSVPSWPQHADLVIIGNDTKPTANSLRHIRDDLGLQDRVRFLGWLETADAELRMSQADLGICLLDPKFEQFRTALGASNKRYQFMKAGLPQIGDMNPGVSDLLEGIGACVSSHAPEQIAELVTAYASDPKRCAEEVQRTCERFLGTR